MITELIFFAAIAFSVGTLLMALRLRRYRLHWHWSLWNRELYKRDNYDPAGWPLLLAFEMMELLAIVSWFAFLLRGRAR